MNKKIKKDKLKTLKWATCVPLIGGSAIGCSQGLGTKPQYHLSYSAFNYNEKQIEVYWPDVHRFLIDSEDSISKLPEGDIDFVNCVCPCAGLSMLNRHASADAKQNDWMYNATEWVLENIKPKVCWGENAPALATTTGKKVAEHLAAIGRKYGYSFSMIKTNAMEHGLPQNRQRTFYFLWRSKVAPLIGYHKHRVTPLYKYLRQIPENATQQDCYYRPAETVMKNWEVKYCLSMTGMSYQEFIQVHGTGSFCWQCLKLAARSVKSKDYLGKGASVFIEWLKQQENTEGRDRLIKIYSRIKEKAKEGKGYMDSSFSFGYKRINAWVGQRPFNMVSSFEPRFWNVREMLHIMGLPHDFELQNWKKNMNTICQNVPVPTTRDFVYEVARFCLNDPTMVLAPGNYVVQNNCNKRIETTKMIWS